MTQDDGSGGDEHLITLVQPPSLSPVLFVFIYLIAN